MMHLLQSFTFSLFLVVVQRKNKNDNIKKAKLKKSDGQTKFDKCRVDSNKIIHTLSIRAMHHRRTNGRTNHNYINASLLY